MNPLARLVFPSLRWRPSTGYAHERAKIDATLALGVGGYIVFGGEVDVARRLASELRAGSEHALLIASDLERGPAQQFDGLTELPPPAALGFVDDLEITARCGTVTGAEARAVGVDWIYAPVADLDLEPENPIVQTRSFGDRPGRVGEHVAAWIRATQDAGPMACAKHYPGHGRTTVDSHETLPRVATGLDTLRQTDLVPFEAAVSAGVRSIMTAHVAYDAWDSGTPATLSAPVLGHLRAALGFDGLIVTDALIMEGALRGGGEARAAREAVAAGCDALLYPRDPEAVVGALDREAADRGRRARLDDALARIDRLAAAAPDLPAGAPVGEHRAFASAVADLAVHTLRGTHLDLEPPLAVTVVDDDVGGPYTVGPRDVFERTLRDAGLEVRRDGSSLVIVFAEPRSWKGRAGLGARAEAALARAAPRAGLIVLCGHPRLLAQIPGDAPVVCAWHGQPLMQAAVARWVLGRLNDG